MVCKYTWEKYTQSVHKLRLYMLFTSMRRIKGEYCRNLVRQALIQSWWKLAQLVYGTTDEDPQGHIAFSSFAAQLPLGCSIPKNNRKNLRRFFIQKETHFFEYYLCIILKETSCYNWELNFFSGSQYVVLGECIHFYMLLKTNGVTV